jgi:hypothetical protein
MAWGISVLRGAAAAIVVAVLMFGLALLADLADSESRLIFLVGAAAGVALGLMARGEMRFQLSGVFLVGLGAVVSGLATGWGWLEYSGVIGAGLAAVWLMTGERLPTSRWHWLVAGGVVALLVAIVILPSVLDGGTLDFDESAYGVKAKAWLEDTPDTGWTAHRGIAMSLYGYVILALGGSEPGLRLLGLAGLLGLAAGVWLLGRHLGGPRVGAIAAVAIVAGPAVLRRGSEYLSDVPAAAALVFCMVIVWRELGRDEAATYRLLWALPVAWIAFYLRYQSILSLGLIGLTVAVLWWPKLRRRPGPVLLTVAIGLIGLIPHFVHAIALTGKPWGILTYTGGLAERAYVGQGLVDYANQLGWPLAGFVGPILLVAAIVGLATSWRHRSLRQRYLFLLLPASLQVIALGLLSHGEPRFIFFPLALIVVGGAIAVDAWISRGNRVAVATAWGLVVVLVGSIAFSAAETRATVEHRALVNSSIQLAAEVVRAESGTATCAVLTTFSPQVTFYSGCSTNEFQPGLGPETAVESLEGEHRFMVVVEDARRQPEGPDLAAYLDLTSGEPVLIERDLDVAVYAFAD